MPWGMRQHAAIAPRRAHERERDPGVARRRLDDGRDARLDQPVPLGGLDHRHPDPVLHRPGGVVGLELADHLGVEVRGQPREAHHRRAADDLGEVGRNVDLLSGHSADDSPSGGGARDGAARKKRAGPRGGPALETLPGRARYSVATSCTSRERRRHRLAVREEELALGLPGARALLRRDDQRELLLALLDRSSSGVFVSTRAVAASGALGRVLIGGMLKSRL